MSNDYHPPSPDPGDPQLDALIRRAARYEADPEALARLRLAWQEEIGKTDRSWSLMPLAAAACFLVFAGTLILYALSHRVGDRSHVAQSPVVPESLPEGSASQDPASPPNEDLADGRAATPYNAAGKTPYEQLLVQAALPRETLKGAERIRSVRRRLIQRLPDLQQADEQVVPAFAAKFGLDVTVRRFLAHLWSTYELGITVDELESELGRLCQVLRGPRREAAVKLLSHLATGQSLDLLLQLWSQPAHQDDVAPAIARLANGEVLALCYLQASSPRVRSVLASALVDQLTAKDAMLVIELLNRAPQRRELIAELQAVDRSVADALLAELDAESRAVRYAAARVLGRLNRPEVSRQLIKHVRLGHRRQEALVALAASSEPLAVQFLSQARQNTVFGAALQSALVQSNSSQPWSGG